MRIGPLLCRSLVVASRRFSFSPPLIVDFRPQRTPAIASLTKMRPTATLSSPLRVGLGKGCSSHRASPSFLPTAKPPSGATSPHPRPQRRSIRAKARGVSLSIFPHRLLKHPVSDSFHRPHRAHPQIKEVVNRPEITPLFSSPAPSSVSPYSSLVDTSSRTKKLRLDHNQQQRLKTKTEDLDFDEMAKVADDPDGKLTKEAIEEEKKRKQRLEGIREEKDEEGQEEDVSEEQRDAAKAGSAE